MKNFDFDGDLYLKASKHQKEWGLKLIGELSIQKDDRILDLGCGDGMITRMIKDTASDGFVMGIDASQGMISKAMDFAVPGLEYRVMDIDDMNFEGEFDLIISNAALHWVKDHRKLMNNCRKALKEGGVLRFNFAGHGNCSNFYSTVKAAMKSGTYRPFFENFLWPWYMPSEEEYRLLLSDEDFNEFRIWKENADRYFANEEEMIRWIDQPSIVPFLSVINDEDVKSEFRKDVIEDMIKLTRGADGRCFETFRRINLFAKK